MAAPGIVKIQLPRPHTGQQRVIAEAKRFNVVCCGRRWGKSTLGIDRIIKPVLEGFGCGWFSPSYKLLMESWRTLQDVLQPIVTNRNNAEFRLELRGGGSITMFSLDADVADGVRGRAFKLAVVDEAALVKNLRVVWENAIRPTLADHRGDAWFLSTPRGMNDFKALFDRGRDPEREGWMSWRMPTSTNPHISPEEISAAKRDMAEAAFSQEFLAQFVNWEGAVFRHIVECAIAEPTQRRAEGHQYAVGVDWGGSNDFTVFAVIDINTRSLVEIDRSNQVDYHVQRGRLQALCDRWKPQTIIAEANSIGMPIIEELQRSGLPVQPFITTNASKAGIIEALALAFEQASIRILPDPVLLSELAAFAAEPLPGGLLRYGAPSGQHDDTVIALALAWSAVRNEGGLGLVEFLKAGQRMLDEGKDPFAQFAAASHKPATSMAAPSTSAVACPKCGYAGPPQKIPGNALRCARCAAQWWPKGRPPTAIGGLTRGDLPTKFPGGFWPR